MSASGEALAALVLRLGIAEIVLVVLALHLSKVWQLRLRKQFHDRWRPLLVQSLVEAPDHVPRVRPAEVMTFLYFWNYFHQSLLGEDKMAGLNHLARMAGMDQAAKALLTHRSVRKQVLAIKTLGHLRDRSMWSEFVRLAGSKKPAVSLAAARALIHTDASAAVPILVPMVVVRTDWSPAKVASLLQEMGPEIVAKPLAKTALSSPPDAAVRLIHYLMLLRGLPALPLIRTLLRQTDAVSVRTACLRFMGQCEDPQDLEVMRVSLGDPSPSVRAAAAMALGRMGVEGDDRRLIALLNDPEWEVRYRAAEALARLPFVGSERLDRIHAEHASPLAREVLAPFLQAETEGW